MLDHYRGATRVIFILGDPIAQVKAGFLGVVNVARRNPDGSWHGDMLDGEDFADPQAKAGCEIKGNGALVVGAGGAGSAIALALLDRGLAQLAVHDVDTKRREALIARLDSKFPCRVVAGSADPRDAGIVVNATPLGMKPGDPLPVDVTRLTPSAFVGDVVTVPEMTSMLLAARQRGCRMQTGIGMFQGNLGLMADFFAGAAGCDNAAR